MDDKQMCICCGKSYSSRSFYKIDTPLLDNKFNICKKCINKIIKDNDMDDILFLLKLFDRPFLKEEWEKESSIGTYLKKFNLTNYKDYTFEDSDTNFNGINIGKIDGKENQKNRDKAKEENKKIYSDDWRGWYEEEDLKYLNNYLKHSKEDFNILTINHLDYAKKIAKASLAMDKAYEDMIAGVQGSAKMYKDLKDTFDNLCKSAQFSEQTRSSTNAGINGISEIVDKVETKEWIKEIKTEDFPEDKLDHLLNQFSNIEKSL